ncbi:hypothetical protein [Galbibacter sp.]|uniref:hypothetical protein n=1 Tax=Galbibacter sp. TaxID=2918471 RepID=UPI003A954161
MWISITDISVKQVDANHLRNPNGPGNQMILNLFQREGRSAFWVTQNKRVYPQYLDAATGKVISRRKWTDQMKSFAQKELDNLPPHKGRFKITIVGWIFLLFTIGIFGYIMIEALQAPAKKRQYQQELAEKARVAEGDIYLGRIEVYKEKGNFLGMNLEFGWFKIQRIENGTYYISKSVAMAKNSQDVKPQSNTEFSETPIVVKPKELEPYYKTFISEDGLTEISLTEKKE